MAVRVGVPAPPGVSAQLPLPLFKVAVQLPPLELITCTVPAGVPARLVTLTLTVTGWPKNAGCGVCAVIAVVLRSAMRTLWANSLVFSKLPETGAAVAVRKFSVVAGRVGVVPLKLPLASVVTVWVTPAMGWSHSPWPLGSGVAT